MSINWQYLRPLNNSQNAAFEELCSQLAAYEPAPVGSKFIRRGAPDAGIECYRTLPNGDELGWQAKFFLSTPSANQWKQIDESVKTALAKHSRLTSLTICLPIDRQDPKIEQQNWFMDEWNTHVQKWQSWAKDHGVTVGFKYWGAHEVWERLSREEHRGRYYFWFHQELFNRGWFQDRVDIAIANAGARYSRELNVDLPIAKLFDGLARTKAFFDRVTYFYTKIRSESRKIHTNGADDLLGAQSDLLDNSIRELLPLLSMPDEVVKRIDFESIANYASTISRTAWTIRDRLDELSRKAEEKTSSENTKSDYGYQRHLLYRLAGYASELVDYARSTEAVLANIPALLLVGEAGTGKSHLFCDVADGRAKSDRPTLLLLGEHFGNVEPWSQITRLLGFDGTKEDLLGALEAAAQVSGERALILIDGLNEGEGKVLWPKYLAGMLTTLSNYPWIGFAVSVRSSYEEVVVPEGIVPDKLVREEHLGFAEQEFEASESFFEHYGIKAPSVPLLNPEFQNPLFLKTFCKGLENLQLTELPAETDGIAGIFNLFVHSINEKLSKPGQLDFDPHTNLVLEAINGLADKMTDEDTRWLPRATAQQIVDSYLPGRTYETSLFRHLISEGLLSEDLAPIEAETEELVDAIRFSYERLSDHLITKRLLELYLDHKNPALSFLDDQPLGRLFKDNWTAHRNRGVIEALSIQIPELIGKELADCVPQAADWRPVLEAFVESVMWRNPRAITESTREYVNSHVIHYDYAHELFLEALLTVASNPRHPFNADLLDRKLKRLALADRDSWWSVFLHEHYTQGYGSIHRTINWAWSPRDKTHIDDESIRLCASVLVWFLTSSNRFLRDRATKALVCLLTPRIGVLGRLIVQFAEIDDPYVVERLYAVAYGCAMRTSDPEVLNLATHVYEKVFKNGRPTAHVLLRDYARGVIERALESGDLKIEMSKVRPPYKSEWPSRIPTKKQLEKHGVWTPDMPDNRVARTEIYESVMGFGDFARYIIGTNSGHFEWTSRRFGEPKKKEIVEAFVNSLTQRQKKEWDEYMIIREAYSQFKFLGITNKKERRKRFGPQLNEKRFKELIAYVAERFRRTLGNRKLALFEKQILPYLEDHSLDKDRDWFDLSIAQRWIFKKVLDLGWTEDRFGRFDRFVNQGTTDYRSEHKPERIGKKYQWIAYHEFLARVSDNFEFTEDAWSGSTGKYEGPWQPHLRDIDPSCLLRKTGRETWSGFTNTWWFPVEYNNWNEPVEPDKWLRNATDLPSVQSLIEVSNPLDESNWLLLDSFYKWDEPVPFGEDKADYRGKEIWYFVRSYIVRKSDATEVFRWAKKQKFMGRWMPEPHDLYQVFLGEFYRSPAYQHFNVPYYHHEGWTRGHRDEIPAPVYVTTEGYAKEGSVIDCSVDEGYHIRLPANMIADGMKLRWNGQEGLFFDESGILTAFDPSVRDTGPGALLVRRDSFFLFLQDNDYEVFWTILGEMNDYSGGYDENWKGRLEISGAYRYQRAGVNGAFRTQFMTRDSR
jgi:hypothetical protein